MPEIEAQSAFSSIHRPTSSLSSILDFREPITRNHFWYQCLMNRARQYMVSEIVSCFILVLLLINSYKIIFENQKNFESISLQITNLEKRLNEIPVPHNSKKEEPTSETKTDPPVEPTKPEQEIEFKRDKLLKPTHTLESSTSSVRNYNAASLLSGASVDTWQSSEYINSSFFYDGRANYVILEREPVPNKSWCTEDQNAHLTIRLSKYIHPIAVSYQHVKWSETVPDGAPKVFDVVACMDRNCDNTAPLVTGCEYKSSGPQEQFCLIPYNLNSFPTNKTQFRFRENHGNVNITCAYLVRVFGEQEEEVQQPPKDHIQTCASLKYYHEKHPFIYNYFKFKTCDILYKNQCCSVCPECCTECSISKTTAVEIITLFLILSLFLIGPIAHLMSYISKRCSSKRSKIRAI